MKRVLLLGGGHAHVHVLKALAAQPLAGAEVTLVSPHPRQIYSGMLPGWLAGHYQLQQCVIPLLPLAVAARVRFIESSAVALDAAARQVQLRSGETLGYELLSLDTGAVMDRDHLAGAREHGLFLRPLEHFVSLVDGLFELATRKVLDVVVVGGGAAGVEMALAMHHRLALRAPQRSRISLVCGKSGLLAGYPPRTVAVVQRWLKQARINVLNDSCTAVAADHVLLGGGARLACDAPLLATGPSAPPWLAASGLARCEAGFALTGPTLQSSSHADVFAVGDVATRADSPHPRSGVFAVRAGAPLAANLRAAVGGAALLPHHPPARSLNLLAGGDRRAVASWGRFSAAGAWAWWWKDRIDRGFVRRFGGLADEAKPLPPTAAASDP